MQVISKETIIQTLREVASQGWIPVLEEQNGSHVPLSSKKKKDGAIGEMIEYLLGVKKNNLPIPNAAGWELKTHTIGSASKTSLLHKEPDPACSVVSSMLLPIYGWRHKEAGTKHPYNEKSFRATLSVGATTSRGFGATYDESDNKVTITFNPELVTSEHSDWLNTVLRNDGKKLPVEPYWGISNLYCSLGTKLKNCFFIGCEKKIVDGNVYMRISEILKLMEFSKENLIDFIKNGNLYFDFDARTGHNHGTKMRVNPSNVPNLYETKEELYSRW